VTSKRPKVTDDCNDEIDTSISNFRNSIHAASKLKDSNDAITKSQVIFKTSVNIKLQCLFLWIKILRVNL
jgi:hypothetical protein